MWTRALIACLSFTLACGPKPQPQAARSNDYQDLVAAAQRSVDGGRPERAIELAAQATALAPEKPDAFAVWGLALVNQDNLTDAIAKYEEARRLGSDNRATYVGLTAVYDVTGQYAKSAEVYREWLSRHPDDAEMLGELGMSLVGLGQTDEGVSTLQKAVSLAPADTELRQDLGYALFVHGALDAAAQELEALLTTDKSRVETSLLLAKVRLGQGAPEAATKLLDSVLAKRPDDIEARVLRARLRQAQGDLAGAITDYEEVLRRAPEHPLGLIAAAGALIQAKRLDDATRVTAQARKVLGDRPEVRFREAQLAWRRGDRAALDTLAALAEQRPTDLESWREVQAAAEALRNDVLADKARRLVKALSRSPMQ